jgi:hypothetical protein
VSRRALILLVVALLSSSAPSLAQTTQADAPLATQARSDDTGKRVLQGNDAPRMDVRVYERRADADGPPAGPPAKDVDVTVGLGSSVDRAPRDIREPFDE